MLASPLVSRARRKRVVLPALRLSDAVEVRRTTAQRVGSTLAGLLLVGFFAWLAATDNGIGGRVGFGIGLVVTLFFTGINLRNLIEDPLLMRIDTRGITIRGDHIRWEEIAGVVMYASQGARFAVVAIDGRRGSWPWDMRLFGWVEERRAAHPIWHIVPVQNVPLQTRLRVFGALEAHEVTRLAGRERRRSAVRRLFGRVRDTEI